MLSQVTISATLLGDSAGQSDYWRWPAGRMLDGFFGAGHPEPMWDTLYCDVNLARMTANGPPFGALEDAVLAVAGGRIEFVGPRSDLSDRPERLSRTVVECGGGWMTPGLIDCHTHLVYGGSRAQEFEQRLRGVSYAEIARRGGGILSTVSATRAASEDELLASAVKRLDDLLREGVTTVEVKSGYGLETGTEIKMLEVARRLAVERAVEVKTTFLGAHALPPEYAGRQDDYVDLVCNEMIPAVSGLNLADAVDAFCENIAFSPDQTARVFDAASRAGLRVKLHADQLSDQGGAALAARYSALSADHLEYVSDDGVRALANSGTVAGKQSAAHRKLQGTWGAAGGLDRLQPRFVAGDLTVVDAQYGVYVVSPDGRRGAVGRHGACSSRARRGRKPRYARARQGR